MSKAEQTTKLIEDIETILYKKHKDLKKVETKTYIAYKKEHNLVCIVPNNKKGTLKLYLKQDFSKLENPPSNIRCVKNIGHHGTGDLEVRICKATDVEMIREMV
ncbi:MAG: hypothetical protein ACMXYK_00945 [Candidatus Woesearchaeota archaeon]